MTDPVDARLLAALADIGKVAVHELAARVGMDPREAAYRLVNLSATGLPLLVGVESDPHGLRAALANAPAHAAPVGGYTPGTPAPTSPPGTAAGTPGGGHPVPTPGGGYPVAGTPSGPYPGYAPGGGAPAAYAPHTPGGGYPADGAPPGVRHGAHPVTPASHGTPSGPYATPGSQSGPYSAAVQVAAVAAAPSPDPAISTWGPPQSASWARGDRSPAGTAPQTRSGRPGDLLETHGIEGEQLTVQLLEVQDPADYLFSAAGYRLEEGERAIVVHTEVSNRGTIPFASLPDNYLELITADGAPVAKAPVSLTSRQPHRIGVGPGETSGGHTVYVVPEDTRIVAVRWSPRPEPDEHTLTWTLD